MKIGIKFCGGCNPRYDRGTCVRKLKEHFADVCWVSGSGDQVCDIWLLVCGCQRGCIDTKLYVAKEAVIKLFSPMDFEKAEKEIAKYLDAERISEKKILYRNDRAELIKEISEDDIMEFGKLTMDHNKLHTDPNFAAGHRFQRPVAHGMMTLSLLSAVMGTRLPGNGTVLMGCQSKFVRPVYPGDRIKATVVLKRYRDFGTYYIAELQGVCTNQKEEIVTEMTASQMLDKQFFQVKER